MTAPDPLVLAGSLLELGRELHRAAAGRTASEIVLLPAQAAAIDRRLAIASSRVAAVSVPLAATIRLMAASLTLCPEDGLSATSTRDLARGLCSAGGLLVARTDQPPVREVAQ